MPFCNIDAHLLVNLSRTAIQHCHASRIIQNRVGLSLIKAVCRAAVAMRGQPMVWVHFRPRLAWRDSMCAIPGRALRPTTRTIPARRAWPPSLHDKPQDAARHVDRQAPVRIPGHYLGAQARRKVRCCGTNDVTCLARVTCTWRAPGLTALLVGGSGIGRLQPSWSLPR